MRLSNICLKRGNSSGEPENLSSLMGERLWLEANFRWTDEMFSIADATIVRMLSWGEFTTLVGLGGGSRGGSSSGSKGEQVGLLAGKGVLCSTPEYGSLLLFRLEDRSATSLAEVHLAGGTQGGV